jgi:hypothetical protein
MCVVWYRLPKKKKEAMVCLLLLLLLLLLVWKSSWSTLTILSTRLV